MNRSMLASRVRCMRVARTLQSYLDGELDPATVRAVERHLEECRRCGLEVETYQAIKAAIAATAGDQAPEVDGAAVARLQQFAAQLAGSGPDGASG